MDSANKPQKVIKFATDITAKKIRSMEDAGKISAIARAQAVIEFNLDGTIITANDNFLAAVGYRLEEIQGKHHSMFVAPGEKESAAYREFWASLNRGQFQSAEYKRYGKGGKEIWILASYNPILDDTGKPFKVVKFASDVSEQKLKTANFAGQIEAIGKSQAVIEFDMSGKILFANENFLGALGYSLAEIQGKHHQIFVPADQRESAAYREFWAALNRGEFQSGEYQRVGKDNRGIWIQASYNPIRDLNGKPYKVVKYATDTTAQVIARMRSEKVRGMMEQVAAGAEELNASVREISEAMTKSKDTAMTAVGRVEAADQQAHRLSEAAESMSSIVQLIGDITGQINLLALNATIESGARRRGRSRFCGGCLRGQESRQPGQAGHRQDRAGNRQSERDFRRGRRGPELDQEGHSGSQRIRDVDGSRRRGTEHRHVGDVDRHEACRRRSRQHRPGGVTVSSRRRPGPTTIKAEFSGKLGYP